MQFNDEFTRVKYVPDRFNPIVEHRKLERKQVGTWLFGLLPVYEYFYSDWIEERHGIK